MRWLDTKHYDLIGLSGPIGQGEQLPTGHLSPMCALWGCVPHPLPQLLRWDSEVNSWKAWWLLNLVAAVSWLVCRCTVFVYLLFALLLELNSVFFFSFGKVGITILIVCSFSLNRLGLILMDKNSFHVLTVTEFVKVRLGSCLGRVS